MRLRRELAMNRQGNYSASELVAMLLVVVAGIVIIILFIGIRKNIDGGEEGVCAAQVQAAAATNKVFGQDYVMSVPACQTQYLTIERDALATDPEKARTEVKQILAEEMRKCSRQWGRGELDLFREAGDYCAFCANIGFDEGVRNLFKDGPGNGNTIPEFSTYLSTTQARGEKVTYAEYLSGIQRSEDGSTVRNLPAVAIELQKNYTVLFTYSKVQMSDDMLRYWADKFGADITPGEYAKISAVAVGGTAAVAGVVGTTGTVASFIASSAGTAGAATSVLAAAGPVGWVVIGGSVAVAAVGAAAYVGYKTIKGGWGATKIGATAGALTYIYARADNDYFVISATYITPNDPESVYVKACGQMAEATRSP